MTFSYTTGILSDFVSSSYIALFPKSLSIQLEKFSNLIMFKILLSIPQLPGKKGQYKTLPKLFI